MVAISQEGVLLESFDNNENWKITYFLNSRFKDFTMIDENNILILKESGDVFRYSNFEKVEYILLKNLIKTSIATRVRFYDSKLGFILDEDGNLWISKDGGATFTMSKVSNNRLEDIAILSREIFFLVGEKGGIYKTLDGGLTWKDISHKNITFSKIWNLKDSNKEVLLVLNNFDQILRSEDMGENWSVTYTPENGALLSLVPINPRFGFKALNPDDDETEEAVKEQEQSQIQQTSVEKADILAVGEFGKISLGELKEDRVEFKKVSGGEALFSFYSLIRITFPLLAVWLFFLMLYTLIPNAKVPLKAAMSGSIITSIIFLLFLYAFGIYIRSFSGSTFVIYRALAAVPLFLLGVYSVSNIILLGAEITATLQFRDRYLSDSIFIQKEVEPDSIFFNAIQLILMVYSYQKKEKTLPSEEKLRFTLGIPSNEFSLIKKRLLKAELLLISEKGILIPTLASDDLFVLDIHRAILGSAYVIPENGANTLLNLKVKDDFVTLQSYISDKLGKIRVNHLLGS
jgi:membrane protein